MVLDKSLAWSDREGTHAFLTNDHCSLKRLVHYGGAQFLHLNQNPCTGEKGVRFGDCTRGRGGASGTLWVTLIPALGSMSSVPTSSPSSLGTGAAIASVERSGAREGDGDA